MELVSMEMEAGAKETAAPAPVDPETPRYPYGLRIDLDQDAMARLGITTLPKVGQPMMLMARVEVCGVSAYETEDSEQKRITLQITDMALGVEKKKEQSSKVLYPEK